jgi:hypothetical protein
VRSFNELYIFSLEGQFLEAHVFGNQSDISTVAEYYWYDWVQYHGTSVNFSNTNVQLGHDLGLKIDIGPEMAREILKSNGHSTNKTDVRSLTPEEMASSDEVQLRLEYNKAVRDKLGSPMFPDDYKYDPEFSDFSDFDMPSHEVYEDDNVPSQAMPDTDDLGHDVGTHGQYVVASVRVPIGNKIRSGRVTDCKRELNGTMLGAANTNPMLDTRTYEI